MMGKLYGLLGLEIEFFVFVLFLSSNYFLNVRFFLRIGYFSFGSGCCSCY